MLRNIIFIHCETLIVNELCRRFDYNGRTFRDGDTAPEDDRRIDIYDPSNVEALAKGGIVRGPRHALIGEARPEAVIPLSKAGSGKQSISLSATSA